MSITPGATLDLERIEALVRKIKAPTDAGSERRIAETLHRLTAGWEPLVHRALEDGLEPWETADDPVEVLARAGGPVATWVRATLLPSLSADARRLVALLEGLDPIYRDLVEALGRPSPAAYDELVAQQVVTKDRGGQQHVVPVVAACPTEPDAAAASWLADAARWYVDRDLAGPALRAARRAGDLALVRSLVESVGDRVTAGGGAAEVVRAALLLPPGERSPRLRLRWGQAARVAGDPTTALRVLESVQADLVSAGEEPPPDLVWRLAQVHYGRGDFAMAAAYCRGERLPLSDVENASDHARRLACLSQSVRALGDDARAVAVADEALAVARADPAAEDDAVALTLLTRAVLQSGARRHNVLAEALQRAQLAGDLLLEQRALVNLADAQLVAADFAGALESVEAALALADRTGPVGCFVVALLNSGEALLGLGLLAEARVPFLRCLDLARRHGVSRTPAALLGLAEADYQAGLLDDACSAFEEAADLARDVDTQETLVPALGRLATILATRPRDPADLVRAGALAEEAVAAASADERPGALVARGWVAVARGEDDIHARAATAVEAARSGKVRRALGEALELQAAATDDDREALALLDTAVEVHERAGSTHLADRVRVTASRSPATTHQHRSAARPAARRLRGLLAADEPLHPGGTTSQEHVEIRVLGSLQVSVDGVPVQASAWRSRQARTLLKVLVARSDRPVPRDELCELLWPDDDPAKTGHRLSVLLSTLRTALDPGKDWPPDYVIEGDKQGLRLSGRHVSVDLYDFLADAEEAARFAEEGRNEEARSLLADLLREHAGEAMEDDPYETWATEVRDNVRAVRVQSLRIAARLAGRAGDIDDAVVHLVRLLSVDPYDEPAHQLLVTVLIRARRHGEARRAFNRWSRANLGNRGRAAGSGAVLQRRRRCHVVTRP